MKIVLVTGGFDPVHSGHISLLNHADHLGDAVVVGLNSDEWLARKKGRAFMSWHERMVILDNLHMVHNVIKFDDTDDTAVDAIRRVKEMFPDDQILFANGGDRTATNTPEMIFDDVEFVFGVGGENKANSSSQLLDNWTAHRVERSWGNYRVLHSVPGTCVKELTILPGQKLSMQRHKNRAEFWLVTAGECILIQMMGNGYMLPSKHLVKHKSFAIDAQDWHQLTNPFDAPCRIVEIQYGTDCSEEDIERRE